MPIRRLPGPLLALALTAGCARGGIEGKYYNTRSGEFAMELRGGRVVQGEGLERAAMTYEVRGDSIILRDTRDGPTDVLVLLRQKDGTLSAGLLGSLSKR